jgi:hypothetical protein
MVWPFYAKNQKSGGVAHKIPALPKNAESSPDCFAVFKFDISKHIQVDT